MARQLRAINALKRAPAKFRSLCWDINGKFRKSATVSTRQGVFTVLFADNIISRSLYCDGQYELDLISGTMEFLRSIGKCPPRGEGTIVDAGANNGVISIGALHTGELEQAIAIEPDPTNFSLLQHNVDQNGLKDRVICLPYAVAEKEGELQFELSDRNFGDHRVRASSGLAASSGERYREAERHVITVKSDSLDNLLSKLPVSVTQKIALVWVDVQGYEGYVFQGAGSLLSGDIPVVSEIWPYGIRRAGMGQDRFCEIAAGIWSHYWVLREDEGFVRHPIDVLDGFFDELGYNGAFENVIFTR